MRYSSTVILLLVMVSFANATPIIPYGDTSADQKGLNLQDNGDWLFANDRYLVRFAKKHGYAGVDVRVLAGSGRRLDQYWYPEYAFGPMCRFFDNIAFTAVSSAEIQGLLTMENTFVQAEAITVDGKPALVQKGYLQNRKDKSQGQVYFEKTLVFHDDHYGVTLAVRVPEGAAYRYANVWWDINDDWSDRYENSAGDRINLRADVGDAPKAVNCHRSFAQLDRGYGAWIKVGGKQEEILVSSQDATLKSLPHAGMGIFDGGVERLLRPGYESSSHSCMSLHFIGGCKTPQLLEPTALKITYSVYFLATSTYEKLYGSFEPK